MYACARLATLPTLALPPVCSVIAADQQQNDFTTKRAMSKASRLMQRSLLARRNDVLGAADSTDTIP
jgi:hypothetical protein